MSTAIFGGTFDPVHKGHIAMVKSILREFLPERIIVVPNGNPPHKRDNPITDFDHRYNMLCLAFSHMDRVEISDYERDNTTYRYSVDTMRYFRSIYGEDTFFVMGQDSLTSLHTWYKYETLLSENRFILFPRENSGETQQAVSKYRPLAKEIVVSSMPLCPLSSTEIRKALFLGDNPEEYVIPEVYSYITDHGLYGGCNDKE